MSADALGPEAAAAYRDGEQRLEAALHTLPDKPEESVASTLRALWLAAAGMPCSATRATSTPLADLAPEARLRLGQLLGRRLAGEPLAHITGRQSFLGIELLASPDALIPRRETELLGRAALDLLASMPGASLSVLDACTGSGNLAIAVARHETRSTVLGADITERAVALAARNAAHAGVADRVRFLAGDLLAPFEAAGMRGQADLVLCNPPYISSGRVAAMDAEIAGHEPREAFDGGPLGIRILQRLVAEAPAFLKAGGWLAFEVGAGQGRGVRKRLEAAGAYAQVREVADAHGEVRALCALRA